MEIFFESPVGTPSLGRSQDILKIEMVKEVEVMKVESGVLSGCMLPFNDKLQVGGQLVQLAESFRENEEIGSGRLPNRSSIFISIRHDNNINVNIDNLYQIIEQPETCFYLHHFNNE